MVTGTKTPDTQQRQRRNDKGFMGAVFSAYPIVISILSMVFLGLIAFTTNTLNIVANAEDVRELKSVSSERGPRLRILESNQQVLQESLRNLTAQQGRAIIKAQQDRTEILGVIKDLRDDYRSGRQ